MEFGTEENLHSRLERYAECHSSPEPELLAKLNRETHLRTHMPQMLSGNLQGAFLRMISQMISPGKILEVGTFTGYSAICLASGLREGGILHTLEVNPEMEIFAEKYFREAGLSDKIRLHLGPAMETLPSLEGPFDLVFIDADKENYIAYFELCLEKLSPQGWILADNTLWYGRVLDTAHNPDSETAGIVAFNKYLLSRQDIEVLLLPLRDGLTLIRRTF